MSDYLARQLAEIRTELAELKRGRVTHRAATVLTADPTSATFTAALPDGQQLDGLSAPPQFLPAAGEQVMLRLEGGTPIYEPAGIAAGAVTGREIAPGAVTVDQLAFDLADYTGGTTIFYGAEQPTATAAGDLWLKELAPGPPPEYETRRWNGTEWALLRDQGVTEALANAVAANEAANQAGIDALAAQGTADDAADAALTAQQAAEAAANTAAGKTTTFTQADQPPTTGRTLGDEWIETDQGNRRHVWSGSAWTLARLGAGAISATARQLGAITTYKTDTAPTSGMIAGDFWIRSSDNRVHRYSGSVWEESKDADINTALTNAATAQATADGKVRIFPQPDAPLNMTNGDVGDLWIDTDDGNRLRTWDGDSWESRQLGNGAIQPQSLIASQVIATGTITAPLLEALMVLTNRLIAGPSVTERHVDISGEGVQIMRPTADGIMEQAGQFGGAGDFVSGGRDTNGRPAWTVDETGAFNGRTFNSKEDITVRGNSLTKWLASASGAGNGNNFIPGAKHYIGSANGTLTAVGDTGEIGVVEVAVEVAADRHYWIGWDLELLQNPGTVVDVRIRDGGTSAPTVTSPQIMLRRAHAPAPNKYWQFQHMGYWAPSTSGTHRLLLTVFRQEGTGLFDVSAGIMPGIIVIDLGPRKATSASVNRGGWNGSGGTSAPAPTQQYTWEGTPSSFRTFRGNFSERTDTGGQIVQGWDPSGYNGDGGGFVTFNLPSITGTVDHVEIDIYCSHWYYNSGGTVIWNILSGTAGGDFNPNKLRNDWHASGYPKYGRKTVTFWADWFPFFRNGGTNGSNRVTGISFGRSGGSNLVFYGKFPVSEMRLRIKFTQ